MLLLFRANQAGSTARDAKSQIASTATTTTTTTTPAVRVIWQLWRASVQSNGQHTRVVCAGTSARTTATTTTTSKGRKKKSWQEQTEEMAAAGNRVDELKHGPAVGSLGVAEMIHEAVVQLDVLLA